MKNHIDDKIVGINGGDCGPAEQSDTPPLPARMATPDNTQGTIDTAKILPFQANYRRRYSSTHKYRDTDAGEKNAYFQGVIDITILGLALYLVYKMAGK